MSDTTDEKAELEKESPIEVSVEARKPRELQIAGGTLQMEDNEDIPEKDDNQEPWTAPGSRTKTRKGNQRRPGIEKQMSFDEIQEYESPEIKRLVDSTKRYQIRTEWSNPEDGVLRTIKIAKAYSVNKYGPRCVPEPVNKVSVSSSHPVGFRQDNGDFSTKLIFVLMDAGYGPIFVDKKETLYSPHPEEDLSGMDEIGEKVHPIMGPQGRTEYIIGQLPHHGWMKDYPMTIVTTTDKGKGKVPGWIKMVINITKEEMIRKRPRKVGKQDEHPAPMFRLMAITPELYCKYKHIVSTNHINILPPRGHKEAGLKTEKNDVPENNLKRKGKGEETTQSRSYYNNPNRGSFGNWNEGRGNSAERNPWNPWRDHRDLRNSRALSRHQPYPQRQGERYATDFIEMILNQEDREVRQLYIDSTKVLMMHLLHLSADKHNDFNRKMRLDYMAVAGCCCNVCSEKYEQEDMRGDRTNYSDTKYAQPQEGERQMEQGPEPDSH